MPIIEPVIRPPAEAYSFLLQVTTGCSANTCTFCPAYLNKDFRVKLQAEISGDIEAGARLYPYTRKVFLMDGDAMALSNSRLIPILDQLQKQFPALSRVSAYANGFNITGKTEAELVELHDYKLRLIYIGLESGNEEILKKCRKKSSADEMVTAVRRAAATGIKTSAIVLLGLGGRKGSRQHVIDSAAAINRMQPRYLNLLSLMLVPGTPLYADSVKGAFEELTSKELLQETHDMIELLDLKQTIFRCNHASNYVPLEGRFPQDKADLLRTLRAAIKGDIGLKPELFRGL